MALLLVALVGGAAYGLLAYSFREATDLALRSRMAREFRRLQAPLPPELAAAEASWYAGRARPLSLARPSQERESEGHDEHEARERRQRLAEAEEASDSELGVIFVLPLDAQGRPLLNPNPVPPPLAPDPAAVAAASVAGSDLRTVRLDDGTPVRLLTYRLPRSDSPALLQVGRALGSQERLLGQFLVGLLALGGAVALALGAGSWWLAGRSLAPAQQAWERQQTFVANASHELRAPLTLIRASAEFGLRQVPSSEAGLRRLLEDVLQETDHMARLVDDLLLLSRLDAGRLVL